MIVVLALVVCVVTENIFLTTFETSFLVRLCANFLLIGVPRLPTYRIIFVFIVGDTVLSRAQEKDDSIKNILVD